MGGYPYFPMFVDLSEKHVVVIGAGRIAARRVCTLIYFTPRITVVAPEIHPDIEELEHMGKVTVLRKRYEYSDLQESDLVLAATDDRALNARIGAQCRERGVLANVSSDRSLCDFCFPGVVRQGNVVIGVTASGTDHRKARAVTDQIKRCLADCRPSEGRDGI